MGEWAKLVTGKIFYPILREECPNLCAKDPTTTAYIGTGDENWGMAYHDPERAMYYDYMVQ